MTESWPPAWRLGAFLLLLLSWRAGLAAQVTNSFGPSSTVASAQGANPLPSFQVKRGFRLELAAAEPMVAAPAALAFDERGRLFVAEMRDYPDRRDQSPHLGRIRVLDDLDENGVFQTSTVYAGDLPWPSAVACYGGGVFVAATPQILLSQGQRRERHRRRGESGVQRFRRPPLRARPEGLAQQFQLGFG